MPSVRTPSIIDTRRDQMFPTVDLSEIERVRRFDFKAGPVALPHIVGAARRDA